MGVVVVVVVDCFEVKKRRRVVHSSFETFLTSWFLRELSVLSFPLLNKLMCFLYTHCG